MDKEAAYTYFDMITDQEVNFFLCMGSKRVLNKVLNQSEGRCCEFGRQGTIKAVSSKYWMSIGKQSSGTECSKAGSPVCWQYGDVFHL
jgi:hypothetical protein